MGRPARFLHAPYDAHSDSMVEGWMREQKEEVDKAKAMLLRVREQQWDKKNKQRFLNHCVQKFIVNRYAAKSELFSTCSKRNIMQTGLRSSM